MAKEDWSEAKAWMRATRERIGMTQHDAAVLANLTVDMVKKYESEKYRIQPSGRMREMLEHYLAEHRRAVVAIVERHRGDERAVLSFSRVSDLPEGLPDWVRAEESVKRRAAAVREAAVLLEAEGVAVDYTSSIPSRRCRYGCRNAWTALPGLVHWFRCSSLYWFRYLPVPVFWHASYFRLRQGFGSCQALACDSGSADDGEPLSLWL